MPADNHPREIVQTTLARALETFPRLDTPRLMLRQMQPADAEAVRRLFGDPAVTRYYDLDTLTDVQQALALIQRQNERFERREGLRWGLTLKQGRRRDQVIGTCGYRFVPASAQGELGYDLARPHWRQGLMTEALRAVIRFGFQELRLNRIQALVMLGNKASVGLLDKLGFKEEGVLREYVYFKSAFHDLRCFSLLRREIPR
jgi:ribosomal-protein-alanine N-acetyltransferase